MRIDAGALEPGQVVRASFDERVVSGTSDLILDGPVTGQLEITRTPISLRLRGTVDAAATVACGRCLTEIRRPITAAFDEEFELGTPERDGTESGFPAGPGATLDVTEVIRQHLLLAAPMAPLCRPDCKGICPECGGNRNEVDCGHEGRSKDPRWEPLAELKIDVRDRA